MQKKSEQQGGQYTMGTLEGKTIILTGASSGIGRETAYALAQEGANLVITARREALLKEVAEKCNNLGGHAIWYAGDAIQEETAVACVKLAIETFGQVDILINNAGIGKLIPLEKMTMEDYDLILDSNLRSAFAFTIHSVRDMLKREDGMIVMVSSITSQYGHEDETAYAASKFGMRGFAQSIEKELWGRGIRVCNICPYAINTDFEVGHGRDANDPGRKNWATGKDVAEAIVFCCNRKAPRFVHEIVVS